MGVILPSQIIPSNIAVPIISDDPDPNYVTGSISFKDMSPKIYFYVPTEEGEKKLRIRYSGKTSNVTWFARVQIDASLTFVSAGVSGTATAFEEKTETFDVTALLVGWHYLRLQAHNNGLETTTIENWTVALSAD